MKCNIMLVINRQSWCMWFIVWIISKISSVHFTGTFDNKNEMANSKSIWRLINDLYDIDFVVH